MRRTTRPLLILWLSAVWLLAHAPLVSSTAKTDEAQPSKVVEFLNTNVELQKFFTCRFTGLFRPIPSVLLAELEQAFPKHKFYIAEMEVYLDPPSKKFYLILVTDATITDVVGFVWDVYWTLPSSASFEHILKGYKASSRENAMARVTTLAKLLVHMSNDTIGHTKIVKGRVKVELKRGEGVFRILEVNMSHSLQFGRLTITGPDGKKMRYFV